MAELADAQDLESCGRPCRFDSCYPHQKTIKGGKFNPTLIVYVDAVNANLTYGSPTRRGGKPLAKRLFCLPLNKGRKPVIRTKSV